MSAAELVTSYGELEDLVEGLTAAMQDELERRFTIVALLREYGDLDHVRPRSVARRAEQIQRFVGRCRAADRVRDMIQPRYDAFYNWALGEYGLAAEHSERGRADLAAADEARGDVWYGKAEGLRIAMELLDPDNLAGVLQAFDEKNELPDYIPHNVEP